MNSEARLKNAVTPLVALLLLSCASEIRRFPLDEPMWRDEEDFRTFTPMPEEYFSPFAWDGADQMLFRPMSRFFQVDPARESVNVNAMDEVPDSSWFTNRLSRQRMTTEEIVRGSCEGDPLDDNVAPWTITSAKPNGANPGFIMEDAQGRKFLLKFDGLQQPERATAADIMGSRMYYAAGYFAPCNRLVFFNREILEIADDAEVEVLGDKRPMTWEMLEPMFARAPRLPDGRMRAASSQFLPGRPIGPWRYESTRDDDPNDVIPHEDRRELRGGYVIASWINHFDAREQNTLSMWIAEENGRGHVRHNYIDFGDSFGSLWAWDGISRRLGHASYFDIRTLMVDFVTLGILPRPWNKMRYGPAGETLGYFDDWYFEPDQWEPGYPNPAFLKASEHDNAWMGRILANLTPEHIEAIVNEAKVTNELTHNELVRILQGRHRRILRRWLGRLSPLTWPVLEEREDGVRLCLRDLAVSTDLIEWENRPYWARAWRHAGGNDLEPVEVTGLSRQHPDRVCAPLPSTDASESDPAYWIVDVAGQWGAEDDDALPARVHLYQLGPRRYRIVGLERPDHQGEPGPRD
ncbi:MAG: hypothetical protein AAGE52_30860 [Myxococcota bacterium]